MPAAGLYGVATRVLTLLSLLKEKSWYYIEDTELSLALENPVN